MEEVVVGIVAIVAIIVALAVFAAFLYGAIGFFAMAAAQGFIGIAAYIACWVFLAPVMAVVCVLFGIYLYFSN